VTPHLIAVALLVVVTLGWFGGEVRSGDEVALSVGAYIFGAVMWNLYPPLQTPEEEAHDLDAHP
jgi:hypothetical protein